MSAAAIPEDTHTVPSAGRGGADRGSDGQQRETSARGRGRGGRGRSGGGATGGQKRRRADDGEGKQCVDIVRQECLFQKASCVLPLSKEGTDLGAACLLIVCVPVRISNTRGISSKVSLSVQSRLHDRAAPSCITKLRDCSCYLFAPMLRWPQRCTKVIPSSGFSPICAVRAPQSISRSGLRGGYM